jgi:hypothetical protein
MGGKKLHTFSVAVQLSSWAGLQPLPPCPPPPPAAAAAAANCTWLVGRSYLRNISIQASFREEAELTREREIERKKREKQPLSTTA